MKKPAGARCSFLITPSPLALYSFLSGHNMAGDSCMGRKPSGHWKSLFQATGKLDIFLKVSNWIMRKISVGFLENKTKKKFAGLLSLGMLLDLKQKGFLSWIRCMESISRNRMYKFSEYKCHGSYFKYLLAVCLMKTRTCVHALTSCSNYETVTPATAAPIQDLKLSGFSQKWASPPCWHASHSLWTGNVLLLTTYQPTPPKTECECLYFPMTEYRFEGMPETA